MDLNLNQSFLLGKRIDLIMVCVWWWYHHTTIPALWKKFANCHPATRATTRFCTPAIIFFLRPHRQRTTVVWGGESIPSHCRARPPTMASLQHQHQQQQQNQHLIRLENRHFVWNRSARDEPCTSAAVLDFIHQTTGWPLHHLQVLSSSPDFTSIRLVSNIRGGKGGFGSLLKSQSRQAGARATTNFGACRDLQGRRLRHVNDNMAAQHFAEWQERIEAGQATEEDMVKALVQTTSGVPGWHLQLPSWSDISKKESRTWQRQYRLWKKTKEEQESKKRHERELRESRVQHYVEQAAQATASVQASLQSALQEGLQQQIKRQKRERDPPVALLTLTGDVVLATNENGVWQIQTKTNFATFGVVLDTSRLTKDALYYWELRLVTGGLSQVGWATGKFSPHSETGDGVGDDAYSYAYDGSRSIKLHKSESAEYGEAWSAGDVVGCSWNQADGTVSFSLNGKALGVCYTVPAGTLVFPAASCNPDEIVELHLQQSEMDHAPENATFIGDVLATEEVDFATAVCESSNDDNPASDKKPAARAPQTKRATEQAPESSPLIVEPLDLEKYSSAQELEDLGLDRLKEALMAIGVKCGGTLTQRAERLFSLKGLEPKDFPPKLLAKKR